MAATMAPDLNIPESPNTVDVYIIDTTSSIKGVDAWKFLSPAIPGHEYLATPAFSFLIQHHGLGRSLVFDLGIRKDWWNYSPFLQDRFKAGGYEIRVEKSVREILEEEGFDASKLEAVVWSHCLFLRHGLTLNGHFDHTGNPAEFEKSTALIVGPGFKKHMLPGFPTNPNSSLLEADYAGRDLFELEFSPDFKIGKMEAYDYFQDGSFYFLNSPGHAHAHICALARVTANPPSFVLTGGDAYHHGGELRPSPYLPLPETIMPHPFGSLLSQSCPGSIFEPLLQDGDRTKPFYEPSSQVKVRMHLDPQEAIRTIQKLQEADVRNDILMVAAHDEALLDIVDFFPKTVNDFAKKDWVQNARWKFLMDFAKAVGYTGTIEGKRDWSPPARQELGILS